MFNDVLIGIYERYDSRFEIIFLPIPVWVRMEKELYDYLDKFVEMMFDLDLK